MLKKRNKLQESPLFSEFIGKLRSGQIARGLFEALPEVMFWLKDSKGVLVFANRAYADLLGRPPGKLVGETDASLFAPTIAKTFQDDDEEVIRTREPMHNKLELITRQGSGIEWRVTSKIPLFDENDEIIGTAGISRRLEHGEGPPLPTPQRAISELVDYIHDHLGEQLTVTDLAKKAKMSVSSLERQFKKHLNTTPKQYLVRARIAAACDQLLNTALSIGQISSSLSYQEHASFTRAFISVMHVSPREYRELYSSST